MEEAMTEDREKQTLLRPCPVCGDRPEGVINSGSPEFPKWAVYCCMVKSPTCQTIKSAEAFWNQAFCWKEIDSLRSSQAELRDQLSWAMDIFEMDAENTPGTDLFLWIQASRDAIAKASLLQGEGKP